MISNYVIEWPKKEIDRNMREDFFLKEVFENMFLNLQGTFIFNFKGIQFHNKSTEFISFKKETDWELHLQDRVFNCFYPVSVKDVALVVIDKDKSMGFKLKESHFYAIPYWMTYKFLSDNEEHEQEIVNIKFWSDIRPKLKTENIIW